MKRKKPSASIQIKKLQDDRQRLIKELSRLLKVITEIACLGDGIKSDVIDWVNIGKSAKYRANEAIRPKCEKCGK